MTAPSAVPGGGRRPAAVFAALLLAALLLAAPAVGCAPPGLPPFVGGVSAVSAADLPHSWRPGCPVSPGSLRRVRVTHVGFDGTPRAGELIVHHSVANQVLTVFARLYAAGFPIARIQPVDAYRGDDDASMAADNTSAFNCRSVTGRPGIWSQHAYGWAIDVNPVQNPYVTTGGTVLPPAGRAYLDRRLQLPGMVHAGDATVAQFAAIGWKWGGDWSGTRDYQHFSLTGR
jgi:hypothetical protein